MSITAKFYARYGKHRGKATLSSVNIIHQISGIHRSWLEILLLDECRSVSFGINVEGNWELRFTDINGDYQTHELVKVKGVR